MPTWGLQRRQASLVGIHFLWHEDRHTSEVETLQAYWPEQCQSHLFFFVLIFAMEDITAELDRVTNECRRLQRQAQKERARRNRQRELALLAATIAFCHEPTSGRTIAEATLRKHARVVVETWTLARARLKLGSSRLLWTSWPSGSIGATTSRESCGPKHSDWWRTRAYLFGSESRTAHRASHLHHSLYGRSDALWP